MKKKAGHSEDTLGIYRQVVARGMLPKLEETMMQLEPSGRLAIAVAVLDFIPLSMGEWWGAVPKQLALVLGEGAALAARCCCGN